MTEKRFVDDGYEAIEDQSFTDNLTGKTYYVDYFDDIVELCNKLNDKNDELLNIVRSKIKEYSTRLDENDINDNIGYYMNIKGYLDAYREMENLFQE